MEVETADLFILTFFYLLVKFYLLLGYFVISTNVEILEPD